MNSWKVENPNRLLAEVKNKFSGCYTSKDLRWSIEHNRCFVNNSVETFCSALIKKGDHISISIEKLPTFLLEKTRILHEDSHILVYNKPPFLTSEDLATLSTCQLVHRLDRDTSGLILLAKSKEAQTSLEEQFRKRTIYKEYLALVEGFPGKNGVICQKMAPLHRREGAVIWGISPKGLLSKTHWRSVRTYKNTSLLHCIPVTGRTHQIRVHLKHIKHPIVGDYTYGSKHKTKDIFRPLLHAYRLKFTHPETQDLLLLCAPLPSDFTLSN